MPASISLPVSRAQEIARTLAEAYWLIDYGIIEPEEPDEI